MNGWTQSLEDGDGKDSNNFHRDIAIEEKTLELDRAELKRRKIRLKNLLPTCR